MVNVWEYANELPFVTVNTVGGDSFSGRIVCVEDIETTELEEDSIVVESEDGEMRSFLQSEIESIEVAG